MSRVEPLSPPYEPAVAEDLRKLMPPGMEPLALFRVLAHNPRVLGRIRRGGLLDPGAISLRDRELVILRTTALCGAEYEWGVHVAFFAAAANLSEDEVAATVTGSSRVLPAADRPLFELCDALHRRAQVEDELWARLSPRGSAALVELVALAGQYHAISYLTNALRVPLESGAARFPATASTP